MKHAHAFVVAALMLHASACDSFGNPPLTHQTAVSETRSGSVTLQTVATTMPSSRLSSALPTGAHPDFVDAQIEHSPFAVVVDVRSPDMFFARGNLRTTLVLRGGQSIVRVWRSSRARLGGVAVFRAPALVVAATTSIE